MTINRPVPENRRVNHMGTSISDRGTVYICESSNNHQIQCKILPINQRDIISNVDYILATFASARARVV
jgi:hypothetical protein